MPTMRFWASKRDILAHTNQRRPCAWRRCVRHKPFWCRIKSRLPILILALGALDLMPLGARPQAPSLSAPPGQQVFEITPKPGFYNEPAIAVNPANPQQVLAAFQVNASAAYSEDAGRHWTLAAGTAPHDYAISGDVSVTYDHRGHALLCYIAFDKLGTTNYWGHNATRNGIYVRRSLDGGKTWEPQAVPVLAQPTRPGIPFEDKPYIVADNTRGPFGGNLYIGWTEFSLSKSVILFSRSQDGGASWSMPVEISTHEGLPRDDNGSVEGFTAAVAADGTLYAAWADENSIAFTSSTDGGRTFAPSRSVIQTAPPYFKVADVDRANGFPQIAMDPRSGRLYLAWSDYRNGDVDVFCATSLDQGRTWSAPTRVNSDPLHDGRDQFFQWLAVDPASGAANLIFYDRRQDPGNRSQIVVLARSTDGGKSFVNFAWTRDAFEAHDDFIGDYTGIAALNGRVYGIWTEVKHQGGDNAAGFAAALRWRNTVVRVGVADFGANSAELRSVPADHRQQREAP